jgi:hypothetical protein
VLHERIGRDVAELRARYARRRGAGARPAGDLVTAAVEIFRVAQAAQGVVAALRPTPAGLSVLAAARRPRPSR